MISYLQASKFFQMKKYFRWNFNDTIFFQSSKKQSKNTNRNSSMEFVIQFNGCFWNISRNFYKVFIFAVNNSIKTCTWIWAYRYIACIIDIISIYRMKRNLLFIDNESIKTLPMLLHCFSSSINDVISL